MNIFTKARIHGTTVLTTIQIGGMIYNASHANGAALERAINDSHHVRGLHAAHDMITVNDDIAGSKMSYPIVKSRFLALLTGHSVRADVLKTFQLIAEAA